jgi:tripartite-type tricarboxylate transporter receptor subunit TctC
MNRRRKVLTSLGSLAALPLASALSTPAFAQAWPARPIRVVVPFPPGGLIDTMARMVAPALSKELGQQLVVENKPGAGGGIGAADVARAAPDGYTLLMASPPLTIAPAIYKSLPYNPADIQPVALFGQLPNVLLVNPEAGLNSVKDLVESARRQPGKLNYGSNGNGTTIHLSSELLKSLARVHVVHIPYRGTAMANLALMSKEIDMMFDNLPPALPHVRAGKLKALAVTTATRNPALPDIPTMVEAGYPDFQVSSWFGLAAPRGVPQDITTRLQAALQKVVAQPEVVESISRTGATVQFMDTAQTLAFMKADADRWKKVATFANIQLD